MKKFLIKISIILSVICFLTGCFNLFSNQEDTAENPSSLVQKVKLQFSVTDFDSFVGRTILPQQETGADIVKYSLYGLNTKNSSGETLASPVDTLLKEWTTYAEMHSSVIEVLPGTWTFAIKCYKKELGTEKLFASAKITDKNLIFTDDGEAPVALDFTLNYNDNQFITGKCALKVNVPAGQLNHAEVSIYKYVSGIKNQITLANTNYTATPSEATGYESFTITEADIPNDYYFVEIKFFTDAGAVPTATRVEYMKIAGGQTSAAELTYSEINLRYTVTYHPQLPDGEPVTMPSDFTYNNSTVVTLQPAVADHYNFLGWYETSDYTGTPLTSWTAGDRTDAVNLYAKWDAKSYPVSYYDFAGGQATGKAYSGTPMASSLTYGITIPEPAYDTANGALSDGNEVVFAGWYTDKDCTAENKITTYNSAADLYAKWNYKYVYLDPTGINGGSDVNKGMIPTKPVKTVAEAKTYMKDNSSGEKVYLMSAINISSSTDTVNNPSELTTSTYNNAILQRYSTCTADMITISAPTYSFSNITFDGGAIWDENGAAGVNTGLSAICSLMVIYKNGSLPKVTLNENVIIQNNENTDSDPVNGKAGGGIRVYGELTFNSKTVQVRACKTALGSGGIHVGANSILKINKGVIGGLAKADANYSVGVGAGIRIVGGTSGNQTIVEIGTATGATDGSDVIIANNVSANPGGGIELVGDSKLTIQNAQIIRNKATYGGGIYAKGLESAAESPSEITVINTYIDYNEAVKYGGGVNISYHTVSGNSKYSQTGGSISHNYAEAGGGVFTSAAETQITELSDIQFIENEASESGGAIYISTDQFGQVKNSIVSGNKCTTGNGPGIYGLGTLKLGGTMDVSENYKTSEATEKNIFINNRETTRYIQLISALSPVSGKTKVATIGAGKYPATSYDASDSSTYVQILTEDSGAGYIASSYELFGVEKTGYVINDLGRIKFDPLSAINAGFDFNLPAYTATELTFTAEPSVSAGTLTATAAGGYTTYHWIFDGEILTQNTATLSLNVSSKPAGYYDLLVIAEKDDNVAVATKTVHIVKELNAGGVVPLENLSAYLASLPAGEHNISMIADMSDADNVQALAAALKRNPNVIVNLDLSNAAFTKFGRDGSVRYFEGVKNLKSVLLPATVKSISEHAFYDCGLSSIVIPSSVTSIGSYAFYYCIHLKSIVFEDVSSNWTNPVGEIHKFTADAQENGFFLMYDRNSWTKN